jgi:cell division septal protein FtsQ
MKKFRRPVILLCVVIVLIFYLIPRKIIIKDIECKSQLGECSERIQAILASHIGQSLFVAKKAIFSDLALSTKDDTVIMYRYPSKLLVSVYETEPLFALKQKDSDSFRLIDQDGILVSEAQETALPFAIIETDLPQVGAQLEEKQVFALHLLKDLSKSYQLHEGTLTDDGLLVMLPTKTLILFPLEGDRDTILGSFVLVINQLNSVKEGSTMEKVSLVGKTIDLRFKNPVIR